MYGKLKCVVNNEDVTSWELKLATFQDVRKSPVISEQNTHSTLEIAN